MQFGIPVFGTAAHSWVQSFDDESESFRVLQSMLGESTVYLIDTYDTVQGAKKAASLGRPLWGVRIDSGNLVEMAREVRRVLDEAGLPDAKIMATSDLNEYKILELLAAKAPIDAFGVGTDLATSADVPSLAAVYKLVEMASNGQRRYTAKFSEGKGTLPGAKQVFRFATHDLLGCTWECPACSPGTPVVEPLLRPVILGGEPVYPQPTIEESRRRTGESLEKLSSSLHTLYEAKEPWRVEISSALHALHDTVRNNHIGADA
jgi:nicotinate phosphoribosyltransferase